MDQATTTARPFRVSKMHEHVARIAEIELKRRSLPGGRILDVGCGDGKMMALMHRPGNEVHGLDVDDSAVQLPDYFESTSEFLDRQLPGVDWSGRLHLVSTSEPWPFEDGSFDVVVSNQVCEHVKDLEFLMKECGRVVREGGFSVHVFPLETYSIEVHTGIPFGHRVLSGDLRRFYYTMMAKLRLARGGSLRRLPGESADYFGRTRADFVTHDTANHSWKRTAHAAAAAGFVPSYRYTLGVYLLKVLGADHHVTNWYYRQPRPVVDALLFRILNRVASVTVFLEKGSNFDTSLNAIWSDVPAEQQQPSLA